MIRFLASATSQKRFPPKISSVATPKYLWVSRTVPLILGGRIGDAVRYCKSESNIKGTKTMKSIIFYDKNGDPFCYTEDDSHIYDFDGNPIAYIESESVWNYDGRHLGFMHNGWIIDHSGNYLLFTEQSIGGPQKPFRSLSPLKGLKSLKPLKGLKEFAPLRPQTSQSWSDLLADEFFV